MTTPEKRNNSIDSFLFAIAMLTSSIEIALISSIHHITCWQWSHATSRLAANRSVFGSMPWYTLTIAAAQKVLSHLPQLQRPRVGELETQIGENSELS